MPFAKERGVRGKSKSDTRNPMQWWREQHPLVKLGLVFGLITSGAAAWTIIAAVPREYVDGRVEIKVVPIRTETGMTTSAVRDLQLEAAEGKLAATRNDIVKWEIELKKTTNQASRDLIQKQMEELANARGRLEQQIKTLSDLKQQRK